MKLLYLSSILFLIMVLNAQDEFFEPGYSIGGYGELHWNRELDKDGETIKNQMDFHRFIIYYGYNWTEKWSFKSEVELENKRVTKPYRRQGSFKLQKHKSEGFTNGQWKTESTRLNQIRFFNQVVDNQTNLGTDGLSNLSFELIDEKTRREYTHLKVTL